ncbi:MAG: serine protease [Chloroflexi bacterium]|nr:MAG: serine protease [Chloroflexota bacterium]MBL1192881.1 serine protease [Chloroflexota bacterium]NOH10173.1 trypsin-like peptidase domain-containing protein [Chloroflexota bacterium]
MEPKNPRRRLLLFSVGAVLILLACVCTGSVPDDPVAPTPFTSSNNNNNDGNLVSDIPFEAVVQIWAIVDCGSGQLESWSGSGSIVSPDGFIVTNAHVVLSDRYCNVEDLLISMTQAEDRPPVDTYYADVYQADEGLDIAIIRITRDINNDLIDNSTLNLPTVGLGSSAELRLGDPVVIIGYPGIGGETITLTRGDVSGFTSENPYGDRAFIKTSATIAGGNSGGLAATEDGQLIGIPTQLGYGGEDQYVDCRTLADTNRDGIIDERDSCVPTGGFINALRPIRLALPLLEAAQRGEITITDTSAPQAELPTGGTEFAFEDDFSSDTGVWGTFSNDAASIQVSGGVLQFQVNNDNWYAWSPADLSYDDVIISVDVNVNSPAGDGDFGIICRYQDTEASNFYGLEISEDGYYAIWKYVNDEFEVLTGWDQSNAIAVGASNYILTAGCVGNQLAIAVNGEIVAEATDDTFASGQIGLIAGTFESPGLQVNFDNFLVSTVE